MNDETVLFYAKQVSKFCVERGSCTGCLFETFNKSCLISPGSIFCPSEWNLPETIKAKGGDPE